MLPMHTVRGTNAGCMVVYFLSAFLKHWGNILMFYKWHLCAFNACGCHWNAHVEEIEHRTTHNASQTFSRLLLQSQKKKKNQAFLQAKEKM